MTKHIAILRGDGIGPEIVAETVRVLDKLIEQGLDVSYEYAPLGGEAYDEYGHPYPEFTQNLCRKANAVLLGAVGSPQYDNLDRPLRPERGLLAIRKDLNLFANLRPAILYKELANASTLKPEIVAGLDILIVRELTGDIYFGEPRGIRVLENGEREGYNTMKYSESEIRRIAHVAFQSAQKRSKKVCSVGKANVLETTELWREIFEEIGKEYPDVELSHMYVDNAAMQLVRAPKQFDVIATGNIFGDILSDEASMLTGSIGMLPSASLDENGKGGWGDRKSGGWRGDKKPAKEGFGGKARGEGHKKDGFKKDGFKKDGFKKADGFKKGGEGFKGKRKSNDSFGGKHKRG